MTGGHRAHRKWGPRNKVNRANGRRLHYLQMQLISPEESKKDITSRQAQADMKIETIRDNGNKSLTVKI